MRALLYLLPLVLLGRPAYAAQERLTEDESVSRALSAHPALQSALGRVESAQGLRDQAGVRPNPRLVLQVENIHQSPFVYSRDADTFIYASQLMETGGKRSLRTEVAGHDVRTSEFDVEDLRRRIERSVRLAFWHAVGLRRTSELLDESRATFRQIIEYHEARLREGAIAEADVLRVRLEGERLDLAANSAMLDATRARIALLREMGQTEFPEVVLEADLNVRPPLPPGDLASAFETRAEIRRARAAVDRARSNVLLQKSAARPDLDFLFGYKRTQGKTTALAGVEVPLPTSDRNRGRIIAAEAEVRQAEADLKAAEAIVRAEIETALREFEIRRRQLEGAFPRLREQASESSRIAQAAYREGGTDLLRLLDAERARIDTELLFVRALTDFHLTVVDLGSALGGRP